MKSYGGRYLDSRELRELGVRHVGENVELHSTCVVVGLENISLGSRIRIDAFCVLIAGIGKIQIGDHVHIAAGAFLSGAEGISVGNFCGISRNVSIYTRNDDYLGSALTGPTVPQRYLKMTCGPVAFEPHVVIGAGSIVLPGVTVQEGSVVGSLSLVKETLPPWNVYGGVPARRLRERSRHLLSLEQQLREEEQASD